MAKRIIPHPPLTQHAYVNAAYDFLDVRTRCSTPDKSGKNLFRFSDPPYQTARPVGRRAIRKRNLKINVKNVLDS